MRISEVVGSALLTRSSPAAIMPATAVVADCGAVRAVHEWLQFLGATVRAKKREDGIIGGRVWLLIQSRPQRVERRCFDSELGCPNFTAIGNKQ